MRFLKVILFCCVPLFAGCAVNSSHGPLIEIPLAPFAGGDGEKPELPPLHPAHILNRVEQNVHLTNFVGSSEQPRQALTVLDHRPEEAWLVLSPDEALCRALHVAAIDTITQKEKQVVRSGVSPILRKCLKSQIELAENLIDSVAAREKEKLASTVLQLYFGLAEIHAQSDTLRRSQKFLDKLELQVESIIDADIEELRTTINPADVKRRQLRLAQQRAMLESKGMTLNTQLNVLLGLKNNRLYPIWTDCSLAPSSPQVDSKSATHVALSNRKDLKSLCELSAARSRDISAIGRVAAGQFHPSFGELEVAPNTSLTMLSSSLSIKRRQTESIARREQVTNIHDKLEKAIQTEIARHCYAVRELAEKIQLQVETVESWRKQAEQMRAKRQVGKASFDQLLEPQIEALKAESELFHLCGSLEIAMVKLRSSQGILIDQVINSGDHQCQFRLHQQPDPIEVVRNFSIQPDQTLKHVLLEEN